MIELANVTKAYGARVILDAFDLMIDTGERVVLAGPSGCGKTTILRVIAGFIAPDRGRVSLSTKLVSQDRQILFPPEKRSLGYVFQDLALWPHMTVFENIEFPLKAQGLPREKRADRVGEMMSMVQLNSFGEAYPSTLSGGEQQRVAIARALIAKPTAVLMDEPLSNLDDDLRTSLCDRILELHKKLAFTLVYVTHSRDEIRQLDARTIQLDGSKAKLNTKL